MTIQVLEPIGERDIEPQEIAERVDGLKGKNIGILNNSKPNTNIFLERVMELLADEFKIKDFKYFQKTMAGSPADEDIVEELEKCDVVINGIGDCGGCTSWTVHDGITFESRGVPTATITTTSFVDLAEFDLNSWGMVNLPLVVFQHPLAGMKPEAVQKKADDVYDDIKYVLTTPKSKLVKEYDASEE